MKTKVPHFLPYQGSKRKLAPIILDKFSGRYDFIYEPFAGSAAVSLAALACGRVRRATISDKLEPLMALWNLVINDPDKIADQYERHWNAQLKSPSDYFIKVRNHYNETRQPSELLYLIARCVKNAVRFNANGDFNQSADSRRRGTNPRTMRSEIMMVSKLCAGRVEAVGADFRDVLKDAKPTSLVYLDPPWQGTSGKRDQRYAFPLLIDDLILALEDLNRRKIPYLLSYDGTCGDKSYGKDLPDYLNLRKVGLNAGRSSQATLLGRNEITIESLYISQDVK
ncbi:DNA adenine methylase [Stagnimonas aquatica]|uniref:site-specific DNA-methyltransferase (adenine-specific) n=1 Tax=Stagnimonas aquatica TaxID=2689987 RepID=A0A3N0VA44_9GAMM|nr:DNA adenine methylase [Stagnimonas aquatica]ROH89532.1 DNA adenine methylase [Stagnimonas aquatica]